MLNSNNFLKYIFSVFIFFILIGCTEQPNQFSNQSGDISKSYETKSSKTVDVNNDYEREEIVSINQGDRQQGNLLVHFIDVGQGAAQLLIGPTGKVMLIDGGNNDKEQLMVAYLKDQGITKVDFLIGTHPDADHIGGLDAVIKEFEIGKIYMPRIQSNTKTFEDVLVAVQNKGLKINTAKSGIELEWEPGITVNMIAPINEYRDTNEMSAVVHLTYGETSFLFTGDAESKSEQDMIGSGVNLKADVLLVSHHGSNSSTSKAFLDAVKPIYGVIQVGKNNYGHPNEEVLKRLLDNGVKIYRNDEQGNIVFNSDGKELSVEQNPWKYEPVAADKPKSTKDTAKFPEHAVEVETPVPQTDSNGELVTTASIDKSSPAQNSTVTVTVKVAEDGSKPVINADVKLTLHYKSTKTVYEGKTNDSGIADISFKIGRAAKGYSVKGDITVTYGNKSSDAQISFTPQ